MSYVEELEIQVMEREKEIKQLKAERESERALWREDHDERIRLGVRLESVQVSAESDRQYHRLFFDVVNEDDPDKMGEYLEKVTAQVIKIASDIDSSAIII